MPVVGGGCVRAAPIEAKASTGLVRLVIVWRCNGADGQHGHQISVSDVAYQPPSLSSIAAVAV